MQDRPPHSPSPAGSKEHRQPTKLYCLFGSPAKPHAYHASSQSAGELKTCLQHCMIHIQVYEADTLADALKDKATCQSVGGLTLNTLSAVRAQDNNAVTWTYV